MADKKPVLIEIADQDLEQTRQALHQLPRKGRSLRDVVAYLHDELCDTLAKGYSYQELTVFLGHRGIAIAEQTLRQYMTEVQKTRKSPEKVSRAKPAKPPPRNSPAQQLEILPLVASEPPPNASPPPQPTSIPPRRRVVGNFVSMPDEL